MKRRRKRSILTRIHFLAIIAILSGTIGGLAVGVVTSKTSPSSSTAHH